MIKDEALIHKLATTVSLLLSILGEKGLYEGVCVCGDSMLYHGDVFNAGHMPVDAGHYYNGPHIDAANKLIKEFYDESSN